MKRYGLVRGHNITAAKVAAYLPVGYRVLHTTTLNEFGRAEPAVVIQGEDYAGWTLDKYVIPRLGSGLMRCDEIDLSHPVMKEVPL